ncbi:hypothetical protein AOQ84DRAFT_385807 [Glonium stellatum]|uniref:Uncharacterized protein n=1 Tax=Glonium stellatum TaxID=574774 RepID=A0A8E2F9Q5_9PEZI|nr:hypothetical protein AOQ84DRAFT_385807 [Glonium stellatum]
MVVGLGGQRRHLPRSPSLFLAQGWCWSLLLMVQDKKTQANKQTFSVSPLSLTNTQWRPETTARRETRASTPQHGPRCTEYHTAAILSLLLLPTTLVTSCTACFLLWWAG